MTRKKKELSPEEQEAKSKRIGKRRKHEFTKEEEKELIILSQKGDTSSMAKLIAVNDKYIMSFVRRRKNETDLSVEDLKQDAICGFIEAVHKYNINFDVKLVTYAYFAINRTLNSAVQKAKYLKISQYGFARYRKINQVIAEESKKTGNVPSIDKISEVTGIDANIVDYILNMNNVCSLDSFKKECTDGYMTLDLDSDIPDIEKKSIDDEYKDLYYILDELPQLHKAVLVDYYGLNGKKKKLTQIREDYKLSQDNLEKILSDSYKIIKESF